MDYNKLCSEILKINEKIRYAGVYSTKNGQIYEKLQKGITRYFDKEKTSSTFVHAYMRWKTRQHDSEVIGQPIFAIAKYEKINRITIPATPYSLLMVNMEPDLEPHEIINQVRKLLEEYSDDPNYTPKPVFWG